MKTQNEIEINGKLLSDILAEHALWLEKPRAHQRANLRDADLSGADLSGAYLHGANLRGANLHGAKNIISIGPGGSRGRMLYAVRWDDGLRVQAGCFWGTLTEFEAAVDKINTLTRTGWKVVTWGALPAGMRDAIIAQAAGMVAMPWATLFMCPLVPDMLPMVNPTPTIS